MPKTDPKDAKPGAPQEEETRVDEFALSVFHVMGYKEGRLPDTLVSCYNEYKRRKDSIQPGRLSPEAFAFVSMLSLFSENRNG